MKAICHVELEIYSWCETPEGSLSSAGVTTFPVEAGPWMTGHAAEPEVIRGEKPASLIGIMGNHSMAWPFLMDTPVEEFLEGSYTSFPIYMLTIYKSDLALLRYYPEAISADE